MAREQRGSLIAFACACAAHAALVAWMTRVERPPVDTAIGFAPPRRAEPAPLIAPPPPQRPEETPIGEATGEGESVAKVDLPNVAQSRQPRDLDQAWTRQRPTLSPPPSPESPAEAAAQPIGPAAPTQMVAPKPKPPEQSTDGTIAAEKPETPREAEPKTADEVEPEPKADAVAAAPPPKSVPAPPNPGETGQSDLDPFAKAEGVDFKPGGIEARTGRPVKLVRPRIDLAFMVDATVLRGRTTILLKIETDDTGTPTRVDVVKSSGSRQIDDAIRLAIYSSFFGGKMPDSFPFGITLWQ